MWRNAMPPDRHGGTNLFDEIGTARPWLLVIQKNIHLHVSMHIYKNEYKSQFITIKYD